MNRMTREVAMYLKAYNQTGQGFAAALGSLQGFRNKVNQIFKTIAKAAAAAAAAIATYAVHIGESFEQAVANTTSMLLTAAKSSEQMQGWVAQLSGEARRLGAATAYTARNVMDAMYDLASGGMRANEILAASEGILKLAGATMSGMGETAETVMSSLRQFGMEATSTNRVVNVFAAGIQNSMLNMERLTYAMVYAGPYMSLVGENIEDTVAALALLHNAGLKGSVAGTNLRAMISALLKPSDDLKQALGDVSLAGDGLLAVIKKLSSQKFSPDQFAAMFKIRGLPAANALVKAGPQAFEDMVKAITGTQAAFDMYEWQMNTVHNQWMILKSAAEETGLAIFDVLKGPIREGLRMAIAWVERNRSAMVDWAAAAVRGFRMMADQVKDAIEWIKRHRSAIEPTVTILSLIAAGIYAAATATRIWAGAGLLLNAVISPLGRVVVIGTLIALAIAKATNTTIDFQEVWRGVVHVVMNFGEYLKFGLNVAGLYWNAFWRSVWSIFPDIIRNWKQIGVALWESFEWAFLMILDLYDATVWALYHASWGLVHSMKFVGFALAAAFMGHLELIPGYAAEAWAQLKDNAAKVVDDFRGVGEKRMKETGEAWAAVHMTEFLTKLREEMGYAGIEMQRLMLGLPTMKPLAPAAGSGGYQPPPTMPPGFDAAADPWAWLDKKAVAGKKPFVSAVEESAKEVMIVMDELNRSMQQVFDGGWASIIDSSRTGAEKWADLFRNMRQAAWSVIGDVVKKYIWGEAMKWKAVAASEKAQAAARVAGAVTDTGVTGVKAANASVETAFNLKAAASGFFRAFASLPWVGIGLALGAIVLMKKMMKGFHDGGPVTGRSGRDAIPAWLERGEYVMPAAATRNNLPALEAMRRGQTPRSMAAGGNRTNVFQVTSGSLILADNQLTMRRFADQLLRVLETESMPARQVVGNG